MVVSLLTLSTTLVTKSDEHPRRLLRHFEIMKCIAGPAKVSGGLGFRGSGCRVYRFDQ